MISNFHKCYERNKQNNTVADNRGFLIRWRGQKMPFLKMRALKVEPGRWEVSHVENKCKGSEAGTNLQCFEELQEDQCLESREWTEKPLDPEWVTQAGTWLRVQMNKIARWTADTSKSEKSCSRVPVVWQHWCGWAHRSKSLVGTLR